MNLLLVQSCITDLPEGRLAALCNYGDLGHPGVCIDVFNLEDEHLVHVLSIAWMSAIGGLKIRDAAFRTSGQPRRVRAFGS